MTDDRGDERPEWGSLRRTHFYVNDLFFREAQRIGVGVTERRILDYTDYAKDRGAADGVTIATLGDLIPPQTRPQHLADILDRMQKRGWMEQRDERTTGRRRGRLWRVTDVGQEVREVYKQIAEDILSNVYRRSSETGGAELLPLGKRVAEIMDDHLSPDVVLTDPASAASLDPDPTWSALRQAHFYLNDLFFQEIDRRGVRVIERRILDSLGTADARDAKDGVGIATICDLIPPTTPPQTASSALQRMERIDWVENTGASLRLSVQRWRLTDVGREVRNDYKRRVERILRDSYHEVPPEQREALLKAAIAAENHRNLRFDLIVTLALGNEDG